jgi:hypothetical protein
MPGPAIPSKSVPKRIQAPNPPLRLAGQQFDYSGIQLAIRATSVDGLLHGDAHSKNVLLPRNNNNALGNPIAKLVDFGTSRMKYEKGARTTSQAIGK